MLWVAECGKVEYCIHLQFLSSFSFPSVVCHDSVVAVDNVQSRELVVLFTGYSAV